MTARTVPVVATLLNGKVLSGGAAAGPVPWWSFTKTVLAAAALRLVDRGRLALDGALPGRPYTLRQLLRHTSGIRSYSQLDTYQRAVEAGEPPWQPQEMLERVAAGLPAFEPGTRWAYSNTGYYIIRSMIEEATGNPIGTALDRLIFSPLGIVGVVVGETPADLETSLWGNAGSYDPRWVYHGLLIGPADAAARTLYGILEGDILPVSLGAEMREQIPLGEELSGRPARNYGYGMGLMIGLAGPAGASYGHTGHDPASVAAVYHFPDLVPCRTVAAFLPGDREAEVEWAAVKAALAPVS